MSKKQIREGKRCTYVDVLPHKVCSCMTRPTHNHSVFLTARLKSLVNPNRGERAASLVKFLNADPSPEFPKSYIIFYDRGGAACRSKASNIAT